jgi:hypothetical protein
VDLFGQVCYACDVKGDEMYDESRIFEDHETVLFKFLVLAVYLVMYPVSAIKRRLNR